MLKNKRSPYLWIILILVSLAALIYLGLRGTGSRVTEEEYNPIAQLAIEKSESYVDMVPLPLTYTFSSMPYMIDVLQSAYSQTPHGIAGVISDGTYLYVGEYATKEGTGLNLTLDELPMFFVKGYNRSGSFITPKAQATGYLQGFGTNYCFCSIQAAGADGSKEYLAAVLDLKSEDENGVVVAVMIDGKGKEKRTYAMESAMSIASTIRENPEFETADTKEQNKEPAEINPATLVAEGVEIKVAEPAKRPENEEGNDAVSDSSAASEQESTVESSETQTKPADTQSTKPKGSESVPESSETPKPEPVPESSEASKPEPVPESSEAPKPEPVPESSEAPKPDPTPEPSEAASSAPAEDPNDVSIKSFACPLAGVGMSVTVTTGSYCPDTVVTMETPDGDTLTGVSDGSGTYTFSTTSTDGTYTVKTTHFSQVRHVSVSAHFGG